ncbi:MAG: hypothetical protein P8X46_02395 [Nitrospirales bacterium]
MAKKPRAKKAASAAPEQSSGGIDESALTKGELRKLNALRKSVGDALGDQTFTKWLEKRAKQGGGAEATDKNADMIAETIVNLIDEKGLRIRRGGYLVTRGRGRVIVTPATS